MCTTAQAVNKQALLVGISDYKGSKNDLPRSGVEKDIAKMKKLFQSWGFTVKVLSQKDSLKVRNALTSYANNLGKDDIFIYYYNGHGASIKDQNGDERDGRDEVFVLSDGKKDMRFVDDELNDYLNTIKARKLILFDACHSGTANKGGGGKEGIMEKSMKLLPEKKQTYKKIAIQNSSLKGGEYVVLSAANDAQKALATPEGSVFSREFYKLLSLAQNSRLSLNKIREDVKYNIVTYCRHKKRNEHHPQLSASHSLLKKMSLNEYLMLKR